MRCQPIVFGLLCFFVLVHAQDAAEDQSDLQNVLRDKVNSVSEDNSDLTRQKRTLYLRDNLFGTGTIGLGLGYGGGGYRGSRYGYHSRPSYSSYTNYYGNRYPYFSERPSYVDRPYYDRPYYDRPSYGYSNPYWSRPNGYGWGGNNNYANSQASSLSASGSFGPISGSVSTSQASANAGLGSGYHNGYGYNDGFRY